MTAPAILRADSLHVGDIATGTAYARHGRITHVDNFGPGCCWHCIAFADGLEVTVETGATWPLARAA